MLPLVYTLWFLFIPSSLKHLQDSREMFHLLQELYATLSLRMFQVFSGSVTRVYDSDIFKDISPSILIYFIWNRSISYLTSCQLQRDD